jgi:hypothetical protein
MYLSLPVLVCVLYADTHDGGVFQAAGTLNGSAKTLIMWYSRLRDISADALDGLLVGGDTVVVEIRYRYTPASLLRGVGTLLCFCNLIQLLPSSPLST